ncbi:MAG: TrkH family potassium uptake protein [Bacillota bacterium]|nr:TrkH family potassium uptake protein [Bacillota bacterium]MDD3299058.1 TrkH family potassium uptake protein [Bacillota bacterium]MDD3851922.1 TrkH family potassium uptake protein [Bacillota bacterium]MDD4708376.1 TrkH family potassium uptake protein [Bacillota bacterium]
MNEKLETGPGGGKKYNYGLTPSQVLVLGFAAIIFLGALLLALPAAKAGGGQISFLDALFTATSAVCVTGLAVVDTGTYWTAFGKTVILLLIQVGGLGFMTFATMVFIALGKRIHLRERLIIQEQQNRLTLQGVVRLTKYILLGTLIMEGIGAVLLSVRFVPQFGAARGLAYGVFHSVSAFCNAGFDIMGGYRSLTSYVDDYLVSGVVVLLLVTGGLGFSVIYEVLRVKKPRRFSLHTKLTLLITSVLLGLGAVLTFVLEYSNPATLGPLSLGEKILASVFHSATPRTAGFNTLPVDGLTNATRFFNIVFMFIGGSSGSTAGGIKTTTAGILAMTVVSVIMGREDTEVFKRRISKEIVYRALAIVVISLIILVMVTSILTITEDANFMPILFEAVSAFGTVGLTVGITPDLTPVGKVIIIATMFAGRLGPLTVANALARRQRRKKVKLRYPEEKILVG